MPESERMAKLEQQISDHLRYCEDAAARNDKAHHDMRETVEKISSRLWKLIWSIVVLIASFLITMVSRF